MTLQIITLWFCDRPSVISSSACAEASVLPFRAVKSWRGRISVLCSRALHCSLVSERPGPCYRWAVFIGVDLAVRSNPCSYVPDGQGALLAPHQRRQPHTLESIDEHEYSGYACRSKHFLFGLRLSGQWTALGSRWAADKQLDRAAQRLHV